MTISQTFSDSRDVRELSCDVLVAGGGIAGVCAALGAARNGAKTILVQDRGVLGGNASSEIRMHICGADASGSRSEALQTEARESGIMEEIRLADAVGNPQRSFSMLDVTLYDLVHRQENLALYLNTAITGAESEGTTIRRALALRESTEDAFVIDAKVFIDCTGDGRLGAEAGADCQRGREAADQYGESMANEKADAYCLGSTLLFQTQDMGRPVPFTPPPWARKFSEADLANRPHTHFEYGYWWLEWGGIHDTIKDGDMIRHELMAVMLGVWDHIKNDGDHGAANYALTWCGMMPGKRESRRFIGHHVFTQSDAMDAPHVPDAIGYGGWSMDTHPVAGIDATDDNPCHQPLPPRLYAVPLGCCISRNIDNLMFAGRNMSASHIGFATLRVMATCGVIGQGIGTAAAWAVKHDVTPGQLVGHTKAIESIQRALVRDDCFLPGITPDDPENLAAKATVTASSQQDDGQATEILNAVTRAVRGAMGVHKRYGETASHRWMSDPSQGLPATIELTWKTPVTVSQIELVFDTGLHRSLALTGQNDFAAKMEWGPQFETVRDYAVAYCDAAGQWRDMITVTDNVQRLVRHVTEPTAISALRVTVHRTWGLDHARICRLRCYTEPPML